MDWKLIDKDGIFLQEVNCQYDALDLAVMLYAATIINVDFGQKEAKIVK
jgi:hypothetical protein